MLVQSGRPLSISCLFNIGTSLRAVRPHRKFDGADVHAFTPRTYFRTEIMLPLTNCIKVGRYLYLRLARTIGDAGSGRAAAEAHPTL